MDLKNLDEFANWFTWFQIFICSQNIINTALIGIGAWRYERRRVQLEERIDDLQRALLGDTSVHDPLEP